MLWTGVAILLSLCIVMVLFMIFSVRRSPIPNPPEQTTEEKAVDFENPALGEEGEAETEVEVFAYPTYTGPVSIDAVKSWVEDPANLIDDTNFTIRGNIEF